MNNLLLAERHCSEMGDPTLLPLQQVAFSQMDKYKHQCKERDRHQLYLPSIQTPGEQILTMLLAGTENEMVFNTLKTEFGFYHLAPMSRAIPDFPITGNLTKDVKDKPLLSKRDLYLLADC